MHKEMMPSRGVNLYLILGGAFFILLTLFVAITVSQDVRREKGRFAENAFFVSNHLESVVNQNLMALDGFVALLQVSEPFDAGIEHYARFMLQNHAAIHSLGIIEKVGGSDLNALIARQRESGRADFHPKAFAMEGRDERELDDKPFYHLITFMESAVPQPQSLLGLDVDSSPFLQDTLRRSLANRDAVASPPFRLSNGEMGYVLLRPVRGGDDRLVAMLRCKASNLLPLQVAGDSRLSIGVYLQEQGKDEKSWLIRREAQAADTLASLIFPKFSVVRAVSSNQQPFVIEVERNVDWSDINWDMLAAILAGGALTFPLLLLYASIHHNREMKRLEQGNKLFYMANFDALTGLPNRQLFVNRLEQSMAVAKRQGLMHAVLFLDLDGFKGVNDYYGHQIGDKVLQRAARIFQRSVREIDTVARLGGDEFVILLQGVDGRSSAEHVARKIKRAFRQPSGEASRSIPMIGTSIGIAIYPDDGETVDELLNTADLGMYQDKVSRKSPSHPSVARKLESRVNDAS